MPFTGEGMPDGEKMTIALLKSKLPGVTVVTTPPPDWHQQLPMVVAYRISGTEVVAGYLEEHSISLSCIHQSKEQATDLANTALRALHEGCRDGFTLAGEGAFTRYRPGNGPVPVPDGLTGKHSDTRNMRCSANLIARPLYPVP